MLIIKNTCKYYIRIHEIFNSENKNIFNIGETGASFQRVIIPE